MLTGNKGEWSEIYTLFKALSDGKLYAGDADLNRVEGMVYPIIKIIRRENFGEVSYLLDGDVVVQSEGKTTLTLSIERFAEQAATLLQTLKTQSGSSFAIPAVEAFMSEIYCHSIAEKSTSKSDIRIVIHDKIVGQVELGFSIKSKLGGDSTLFNANKRKTNLVFKVKGLQYSKELDSEIQNINPKGKIQARVEALAQKGGTFEFHVMEGSILNNNLILIDSKLPEILSELVFRYYSSPLSSIKALTEQVSTANPIRYDLAHAHKFYEYKIKKFLVDIALGMTGSTVWTGVEDVTGGYLIVKNDGDLLCYHVYNRNAFENYLFNNTKLDTPGSGRHEFGTVYEANNELFFALNFQIRFN